MSLKIVGHLDTGETDSSWFKYTFETESVDGSLDIRDTVFGDIIPKKLEVTIHFPEEG